MSDLKCKDYIVNHDCHLKFCNTKLCDLPLAMSYTPMQRFHDSYSGHEALMRGTLFPELDKPFYGRFTGEKMK